MQFCLRFLSLNLENNHTKLLRLQDPKQDKLENFVTSQDKSWWSRDSFRLLCQFLSETYFGHTVLTLDKLAFKNKSPSNLELKFQMNSQLEIWSTEGENKNEILLTLLTLFF